MRGKGPFMAQNMRKYYGPDREQFTWGRGIREAQGKHGEKGQFFLARKQLLNIN